MEAILAAADSKGEAILLRLERCRRCPRCAPRTLTPPVRTAESKARAEALVTLLDRLEQGLDTVRTRVACTENTPAVGLNTPPPPPPQSRHLDHLCAVLAVNIPENNVKACVTACAVAEAVASQQGKNMAPHVQTLCAPLLDVLGNAKVRPCVA